MEGDENTDTHTVHVAGQDTQLDPPSQEDAQEEAVRVGTQLQSLTADLQQLQEQMQSAMAGVTGEQTVTKYRQIDDATLHPPYTGPASVADDSQPADVPMGQPGSWKAVLHATSSLGGSGGNMASSSSSALPNWPTKQLEGSASRHQQLGGSPGLVVEEADDVDPAP